VTPPPPISPLLDWACLIAFAFLTLGGLAAALRAVRGPTLPDRVVALDLLATLVAGGLVVFAIRERQPTLLGVALVLALLLFISPVAFSYYLSEGGGGGDA
jgi:multicomponent Na+:H+ antiporter subunit F